MKRHIRFWHIPVALMIISASSIWLVSRKTPESSCISITTEDGLNTIMVDPATNAQQVYKPYLKLDILVTSPDGQYTIYRTRLTQNSIESPSLVIRSNITKQFSEIENMDVNGRILWSPDNKGVAFGALSVSGTNYQSGIAIISAVEAPEPFFFPGTFASRTLEVLWSSDSKYGLIQDSLSNAFIIHVADRTIQQIAFANSVTPLPAVSWLGQSHQVAYLPNGSPDHLTIYDADSNTERRISFPRQAPHSVGFMASPDAKYIVINLPGTGLTLVDLSSDIPVLGPNFGKTGRDLRDSWWTPDSRAFVFVQTDQTSIAAYFPKDHQLEVLVPDHLSQMGWTPDGYKTLYATTQDGKVSIHLLYPNEKRTVQLVEGLEATYGSFWFVGNYVFIVRLQNEQPPYGLEVINTDTQEHTLLVSGLSDPPVLDSGFFDPKFITFNAFSKEGKGEIQQFDKSTQTFKRFRVNLNDKDLLINSDQLDSSRHSISPDQRYLLLFEFTHSATAFQLISADAPGFNSIHFKPISAVVPVNVGMDWAVDSSKFIIQRNRGLIELYRNDGTLLTTVFVQSIGRVNDWLSSCDPLEAQFR